MVVARRGDLSRRDDEVAVDEPEVELGREPPLPLDGVRADVGAREDGRGSHLARGPHRLGHHVAAAHVERGAEPAERGVEIGERLEEERATARGGTVARAADPVVEHEQGQHGLGRLDSRRERRVVVDAQVAGEEDDRGPHVGACLGPDLGGDAVHADEARDDVEHALAGAVRDVRLELRPVVDQVAAAAARRGRPPRRSRTTRRAALPPRPRRCGRQPSRSAIRPAT